MHRKIIFLITLGMFVILVSTAFSASAFRAIIQGPTQGYEDKFVNGRNWGETPLEYKVWFEGDAPAQPPYYIYWRWDDEPTPVTPYHGPVYNLYDSPDHAWEQTHTYKEAGDYTIHIWIQGGHDQPSLAETSLSVSIVPTPFEDLDCLGSLKWAVPIPGEQVTGSFIVKNIGDTNSRLNWAITDWPLKGKEGFDITFSPASGSGLTPQDRYTEVVVTFTVPEDDDQNTQGYITVKNTDFYMDDYDKVPFTLGKAKEKDVKNFNLFYRLINLFPCLKNIINIFY